MSLTDELSNLHLLLRVPSFSRWPLQVRFFCEDVYRTWQGWSERVDGSIRNGIKVLLDLKQPEKITNDGETHMSTQAKGKRKRETLGRGGIEGLNVGYSELKKHVEKSSFLIAENEALKCAICAKTLGAQAAMALVCPQERCRTVSHMNCLATKFVEDEGVAAAIIPISGRCPGCKEELQWIDLMKELTLRARGDKAVTQMMEESKERKIKMPKTKNAAASQNGVHTVAEEDIANPDGDLVEADICALGALDESLPDDWHYQDNDVDDMMSVMSGHSALSDDVEATNPTERSSAAPKLPVVIEDSDGDDAELLD